MGTKYIEGRVSVDEQLSTGLLMLSVNTEDHDKKASIQLIPHGTDAEDKPHITLVGATPDIGESDVILRGIANGINPEDAATLRQVNAINSRLSTTSAQALHSYGSGNKLNFYDPNKIDVQYINSNAIPGWRVHISDNQGENAEYLNNQYFSGAEGMTEHKEVRFRSSIDHVDIAIQPTSAHMNSCTISNMTLTRADGQPTGLTSLPESPFGTVTELSASHFDTNLDSWELVNNSADWYGSKLEAISGDNWLKLSNVQWKGIAQRVFNVTPNTKYTITFTLRVEQDAVNFYVYNGANTSATKLVTAYGLNKTTSTTYTYTATPTGSKMMLQFSAANQGQAVAYLDDVIITYIQPGISNWAGIEVNSESYSLLQEADKTIRLRSPWGGYWGEYVKIPIADTDKLCVMRFKANVVKGGFNIIGENVTFVNLPTFYVNTSGEYILSFYVSAGGGRIGFKGSGVAVGDDTTLSDIHIFSADCGGISDLSSLRWAVGAESTLAKPTKRVTICGNGVNGYINNLQTLAVTVDPNDEYLLAFDIAYDAPKTVTWKPYTTITAEDKIALVTDGCVPVESLNCGGAWTGPVTNQAHKLKIEVTLPAYDSSNYFTPSSALLILNTFNVSMKVETQVTLVNNINSNDTTVCSTISELPEATSSNETVARLLIPLYELCTYPEGYHVDKVTWIFTPSVPGQGVTTTKQSVLKLALFGDATYNSMFNPYVYNVTPTMDIKFPAKVYAEQLVCDIDDGSVD